MITINNKNILALICLLFPALSQSSPLILGTDMLKAGENYVVADGSMTRVSSTGDYEVDGTVVGIEENISGIDSKLAYGLGLSDNFYVLARFPYVSAKSEASIGIPGARFDFNDTTEGLADIEFEIHYLMSESPFGRIALGVWVSPPTASDAAGQSEVRYNGDLQQSGETAKPGSGRTDVSLSLNWSRDTGKVTPTAFVDYYRSGSKTEGGETVDFGDTVRYGVGAKIAVNEKVFLSPGIIAISTGATDYPTYRRSKKMALRYGISVYSFIRKNISLSPYVVYSSYFGSKATSTTDGPNINYDPYGRLTAGVQFATTF